MEFRASGNPTDETKKPVNRWSQDRRLEFIDFRLRWDGQLNRSDLTEFFGISIPQASLDLARYLDLAPDNAAYDRSAKLYLAAVSFAPVFAGNHASRFLNELLALRTGLLPPDAAFMGWSPPVEVVPTPGRAVDPDILRAFLRAIREHQTLGVRYQSMSRPEPLSRRLSPHALGHDGFRWHVRAFCHTRKAFRDFVLGRVLAVESEEDVVVDASEDTEWHNELTLVLEANPELPAAHRRVIELDYGMLNGRLELKCRQSLLFYALKRLGLDDGAVGKTEVRHLVLNNRAALAEYLDKPRTTQS